MKTKDEQGRIKEYKGAFPAMQWQAPTLNTRRWDGFPQEDVQVPAGTFEQAYRGKYDVGVLFVKSFGTAWWHPAVPINGTVKIIGEGLLFGGTTELVGFGDTGATSEF